MPAPSAMFSPLTMQTSAPSSSRSAGQAFLDGAAARRAEHVREEEDSQLRTSDAAGRSSTETWLPESFVYRASACRSTLREIGDDADARRAADDVRADRQRRVGAQLRDGDDQRRRGLRLDVDARAVAMTGDDVRRDADDRAVDRRVHVGAAAAPTSSADVVPPLELVPASAVRRRRRRSCGRRGRARPGSPCGRAAPARSRRRARRGSRSPSSCACAIGICRRTAPCIARICGNGFVCVLGTIWPTPSVADVRALPPKADSSSATSATIARSVRSANRRARRVERTSRRSTRRLRMGREDGMSRGRLGPGLQRSSNHRSSAARYHRTSAGTPAPARIAIPRWVQLVGLPLLLILIWVVAGAVRHAVFLFLVALLIALLLNPLVRGLEGSGSRAALRSRSSISRSQLSSHSWSSLSRPSSCSRPAMRATGSTITLRSTPDTPAKTGAEHDLARLQTWLTDITSAAFTSSSRATSS